ncbi:MAG: Flp pilus assembly complex ATPase component TadA [Alphaproteobacteria bacterium]|nr:Flp pilus assembly complex ATPase component TadA [Alphaproteobacteria bacterium]
MDKRNLLDYNFSDLYIDTNHNFFITDENYVNSLKKVIPEDREEFYNALTSIPHQESSYSVCYKGIFFRCEHIVSLGGPMYCLRRQPVEVPSIYNLGFDYRFVQYMLSLSSLSGLIIWAGSTGSGKTTAISALLAEYLKLEGGFAYTIEDPAEMPLEKEYSAFNGSIGVCKQTEVIDDNWGAPLKSALRSHPRYILIGEIRTPEAAQQCLRAAISGHLVLTTIHANSITDAFTSLVKYAAYNMSEASAYDILSRGILGIVKQDLVGIAPNRHPALETLFANPDPNKGCQVRSIIRSTKLNLGTAIESQAIKLAQGISLF